MVYGYARVSTAAQLKENGLEAQINALLSQGVHRDNIVCEQFSGKSKERPKFQELIKKLQSGDTLVVTKLDRLMRSVEDGLSTIQDLRGRGVSVNILNVGVVDDTPIGKFFLTCLLAMAELERSLILERMAEGKAVARTKAGFREGRPPISRERIAGALELLKTSSLRKVERLTGISRNTLTKYRRIAEAGTHPMR